MAESTAATQQTTGESKSPARRDAGEGDSPLRSERGLTSIADAVVSKVAGIAAREVAGVHALGGGVGRALGAMTQRVGIGGDSGVSVEVGEREAAVDLVVVVEYGESIPRVAEGIRDNVSRRIEGITGLQVTEVNIAVNDLWFPGDEAEDEDDEAQSRVA
ncbi:MAG TPA: Asp23/Gls24 family envelope stress response protein [Solirubrobacteraceae bacterium]|nr:Asp23/Gls24 family envelope stress response protein [Solirubrobacteraceae bacterium]